MSHEAARLAYGLTEYEFQRVLDRLKPIGATCPRKGLAISGLEQCMRSVVSGELDDDSCLLLSCVSFSIDR